MDSWFGTKLRKLRENANLTQEDIAQVISCKKSYVCLMEKGIREPAEDDIRKLARFFNEDEKEWVFKIKNEPKLLQIRENYPVQMKKFFRNSNKTKSSFEKIKKASINKSR